MAQGYKNPPVLHNDCIYEDWKNELAIWKRLTDVPKEKQALAVTLSSLSGQAKAKSLEIPVDTLNKENGLNTLIEAIDKLYLRDKVDLSYTAFREFDTFAKTEEMSMDEFIIEYERRYGQCKRYEMVLPDAVLSFKLLDSSGLSQKEKQLVLTAAQDRKFDSMKSALKRIFGGQNRQISDSAVSIKQESAYYTKNSRSRLNKFESNTTVTERRNNGGSRNDRQVERGTNPINKYGKRTRCAVCQSTYHWAKDCPHKEEVKVTETSEEEQCNLTIFTKEVRENEILLTEALGCAVIDTTCTTTVCGQKWLDRYIESLDEKERLTVKSKSTNKMFRFGDGVRTKSKSCVTIPAQIGETKCNIVTEVVESDIPLLLGKPSLKRAKTFLDLPHDQAIMFDKPVVLDLTSTGHYCINIASTERRQNRSMTRAEMDKVHENNIDMEAVCQSEILFLKDKVKVSDQKQQLVKLHKQFGHASAEKLEQLLHNAGINKLEITQVLKEIVEECDICARYQKTPSRPVVGLPKATDFNETVAVDLHQLEKNLWYLHIIDEFTRFSMGAIMTSKRPSEFVQKFITNWISIFGSPKRLQSDNGGEFNNAEVHDMCENFNIEVQTTAAESPWSNGLVERHNQTLTYTMNKIRAEKQCDWETALQWAIMAKNSLSSISGYSAYQLVFGRNPNLPSIFTNMLPALEGTTKSHVIEKHLNTLHASRKAFMEAESSERIKRALRRQIRPNSGNFETGDKVYYKRADTTEWKGPAKVIGQDGTVVFVRQGGLLVRVHKTRLKKCAENETFGKDHCDFKQNTPEIEANSVTQSKERETRTIENEAESDSEYEEQNNQNVNERETHELEDKRTKIAQIRGGQTISYKNQETEERVFAKVLGRAGKVTGRNKNWFNLEYKQHEGEGVCQSVDLSRVEELEILPEQTENIFVLNDISWSEAKKAEIRNWQQNSVYEEVDDEGQVCMSTRWICTLKETPNELIPKARLVARGFEEKGIEDVQKDSPTCSRESLNIVLQILCQKDWIPNSMDIKTAFLQGEKIARDIYIKPPKEAEVVGKLWHLQKCVYGLSDASLHWYQRVKRVMLELGANISKVDPAVFYWLDEDNNTKGILACHVDDFIWGGNQSFEDEVVTSIRSYFNVGKEETEAFKYLGIELEHKKGQIRMNQQKYIDGISFIDISKSRAPMKEAPLNDDERHILRSKIGQILWVAKQSRPDVIFDVCSLAGSLKDAKVEHLILANKIIRKIKSEKVQLKFQNLGTEPVFMVYSDASFGNLSDGATQGGHMIFLGGENGKVSPICWNSKKLRRVVRSTLAGETLAMADGIDTGVFLSTLYGELSRNKNPVLKCITDCNSLHDAIYSNKFVTEKRLRLEISGIKEMTERGTVTNVQWVNTEKQLADCLTKKGASSKRLLKVFESGTL